MIATSEATTLFVSAQADDFWTAVGIHAKALQKKSTPGQLKQETITEVSRLGKPALRFLCEQSLIPCKAGADSILLAKTLTSAADMNSLIHLREFLRRRSESVREVFDTVFSESERRVFDVELENLSDTVREVKLKPFAKLLMLFRRDPEHIKDVFFLEIWRQNKTYAQFEFETVPTIESHATLSDASDSFLAEIGKSLSGRSVRLGGIHTLRDGTTIVLVYREYNGVIKQDFRAQYNVHFGCGRVIIGVSRLKRQLIIKTGNARLADDLRKFFETLFESSSHSLLHEVYSDYSPSDVENAVLGDYDSKEGVELIGAAFRRTSLPGRSPLALKCSEHSESISDSLKTLREQEIIGIRSLDDVGQLDVEFEGKTARVEVEEERGGAVRLRLDDSRWSDSQRQRLESAFWSTFELPLNKLIDPERLQLGSVSLVSSLLSVESEDDVQVYQQERLEELVDLGLIVREPHPARACTNPICRLRGPVRDESAENCSACDKPISDSIIRKVRRDSRKIVEFTRRVLHESTGWSLADNEQVINGLKYYSLKPPDSGSSEDSICVIFRDRISDKVRFTFELSHRAILVIQPHTDERQVYVDVNGTGRASFAWLYISQTDDAEKEECCRRCKLTIQRLVQTQRERVNKAARHSYQTLVDTKLGLSGKDYEVHTFNLLRAMFPYSYRIAREGKIEPDGFVCLPVYEDNSLDDISAWNLSYDAKYSERKGGYDLDIDERRKIVNYISKLRRSKTLLGRNRKLRAHAIISNSISDRAMSNAAKFVFGRDGVRKSDKDVLLVLIRDDFVTRLYELIQDNPELFERRRLLLAGLVADRLQEILDDDDYVSVSRIDAESLFEELLACPEIESNLAESDLIDALDRAR